MAELNNKAQKIADMLSDVIEEAMRQQSTSSEVLTELRRATQDVKSTAVSIKNEISGSAKELPSKIEAAIGRTLEIAAAEAAKSMTAHWDQANLAAERAERLYSLSLRKALVLAGTATTFGLVVGVMITLWTVHRFGVI